MNLLPVLTGNARPVSRKLFWRYKANAQRAMRDGDHKFLKILDNTFLFNVVDDPLEKANLKDRQRDVIGEWSGSGTPGTRPCCRRSRKASPTGFDGDEFADHYGAKKPTRSPTFRLRRKTSRSALAHVIVSFLSLFSPMQFPAA